MSYYDALNSLVNLNLDYSKIQSLACFLVSLFYKSGCKYSCSRPKISRLLTIYALCRINVEPDLLHYYYYANSETINLKHYHIVSIIDRDVYMLLSYEADDSSLFLDNFDESASIPQFCTTHLNAIPLDNSEKELLTVIFRTFASYPLYELAPSIDKIAVNMPFQYRDTDCVKLVVKDFIDFLTDDDNTILYNDNNVFLFIKNMLYFNNNNNITLTDYYPVIYFDK